MESYHMKIPIADVVIPGAEWHHLKELRWCKTELSGLVIVICGE